jgi:hypothetical protein
METAAKYQEAEAEALAFTVIGYGFNDSHLHGQIYSRVQSQDSPPSRFDTRHSSEVQKSLWSSRVSGDHPALGCLGGQRRKGRPDTTVSGLPRSHYGRVLIQVAGHDPVSSTIAARESNDSLGLKK